MRQKPGLDIETAITELAVGEALVSLLDAKGRPGITERAFVLPPGSQIGPITPQQRQTLLQGSLVAGVYEKAVDRESAYEKIKGRAEVAAAEAGKAPQGGAAGTSDSGGIMGGLNDVLFGTTGPRGGKHDGLAQSMFQAARFKRRQLVLLATAAAIALPGLAFAQAKTKVAALYTVPFEQQWVSRLHKALKAAEARGEIEYKATENVSNADYERVMREYATAGNTLIVGEAFAVEAAARKVAKDFPKVSFLMGSSGKPQAPNFSVFDNYIQEPAYLTGMRAGSPKPCRVRPGRVRRLAWRWQGHAHEAGAVLLLLPLGEGRDEGQRHQNNGRSC